MLDVTIIRNSDGSLDFDVYRKPTHTNQYIHFHSHQPLSYKLSTIHALTRRAALIPSTDELKAAELKRCKEALALNDFPKWAFDRARYRPPLPPPPPPPPSSATAPPSTAVTTSATTTEAEEVGPLPPSPPPPPPRERRGHVALPYFNGLTEPLTRTLQSKGISVSVSSRGSLRETLVKPKDKLKKEETTGHVYHIPCAGANVTPCPGTYVGETERTAMARFQEHTSTAMNALGNFKSAMQHAREENHHFRREDVSILATEQDWVKRGILEAIYIKSLNPSINIDPGRHSLSSHFDKILSDIIEAPPPPPPHDPQTETLIDTNPRRPGRPRRIQSESATLSQPTPAQVTTTPPARPASQPTRQSQRLRDRQQQQPPS